MARTRARARPTLTVQPVRNGRGIVAMRSFAPGALVCRIDGTLLSCAAVRMLWRTDRRAAANCFRYDADRYLSPQGKIGDFANHSCNPNTAVAVERGHLVLRAVRAIAAGDEVTHDYSTLLGADDVWRMRCNCGERTCRGIVRRFDALPAPTLHRYRALGAIPAFIESTARKPATKCARKPVRKPARKPTTKPAPKPARNPAPKPAPKRAPRPRSTSIAHA